MEDGDAALMLAFQRGDEEAFVTLYRRWRDKLVNFARRLLGSQARGEEAAQDVFLKLYAQRRAYRPTARFSTYLFRIAKNHCLNLRARHDEQRVDRGHDLDARRAEARDPEAAALGGETGAAVRDALGRLAGQQAAALVLVHHHGLSYDEAAQVLEVSVSALKSLVHRARAQILREIPEVAHAV